MRALIEYEVLSLLRSWWPYLYSALTFVALLGSFYAVIFSLKIQPSLIGYAQMSIFILNVMFYSLSISALILTISDITGNWGFMEILSAQPISRTKLLLSKFLGVFLVLLASNSVAILVFSTVVSLSGISISLTELLWLIVGTALLASMFTGLGFLISMLARERARAIGVALGIWIFLLLVYEPSLVIAIPSLSEEVGMIVTALNPIDSLKSLVIMAVEPAVFTGTVMTGGHPMLATENQFTALKIFGIVSIIHAIWPLVLSSILFRKLEY